LLNGGARREKEKPKNMLNRIVIGDGSNENDACSKLKVSLEVLIYVIRLV
jgi:hypothetical protein